MYRSNYKGLVLPAKMLNVMYKSDAPIPGNAVGQGQARAQVQQTNKQMLESFVEKITEIM